MNHWRSHVGVSPKLSGWCCRFFLEAVDRLAVLLVCCHKRCSSTVRIFSPASRKNMSKTYSIFLSHFSHALFGRLKNWGDAKLKAATAATRYSVSLQIIWLRTYILGFFTDKISVMNSHLMFICIFLFSFFLLMPMHTVIMLTCWCLAGIMFTMFTILAS